LHTTSNLIEILKKIILRKIRIAFLNIPVPVDGLIDKESSHAAATCNLHQPAEELQQSCWFE
jgi:hypothetical protein